MSYEEPARSRAAILQLVDLGVTHIVLGLPTPYPDDVARWAAEEIIAPVAALASAASS